MLKKGTVVFGNWTVEETIGSGAFGTVYKIKKEDFGEEYFAAMKVIRIPQDKDDKKRLYSEGMSDEDISLYYKQIAGDFIKEIKLLSTLDGVTNIVDYKDHVVEPNEDSGYSIYIKMQLLTPVNKLLVDESNNAKFLSNEEILKLGKDICSALEVCEKKRIIHRDIKIDNIFISEDGDYKLGDFGIARQLEATQGEMSKKGTLMYMAPEVFKGEKYDRTADIYSLGIVLYRLLNKNRAPFFPDYPQPIKFTDKEQANNKRLSGEIVPPIAGLSDELNAVLRKACAYNPRDRYQSASEFKAAIEGVTAALFFDDSIEKERTEAVIDIAHVIPVVATQVASNIADEGSTVALFDVAPDTRSIIDTPKEETVSVFDAKREIPDPFYEHKTDTLDCSNDEKTEAVFAATPVVSPEAHVFMPTKAPVMVPAELPVVVSSKSNSKFKLFAIIGGAVTLVLVAVIIVLLVGGKGDSDDDKSKKDKTTKENNQAPIINVIPGYGDDSIDSNLTTTEESHENTTAPSSVTNLTQEQGGKVPVTQESIPAGINNNDNIGGKPNGGTNNTDNDDTTVDSTFPFSVPNFVGMDVNSIVNSSAYSRTLSFDVYYVDSDKDIGVVVSQDRPEGTIIGSKTTIKLEVSRGREIPEGLENVLYEDAVKALNDAGFKNVKVEAGRKAPTLSEENRVYSVIYENSETGRWENIPSDGRLSASDMIILYYYES